MVEDERPLYADLTAPFEGYYTADGVFGPFLSGEQVASRLNFVLGVGQWQFNVLHFAVDREADEVVALGELKAYVNGQWISRQQFGGQKIKRKKDGTINNLADDHKGAATDAMKKCASLFGVGLYLMVSSATWHAGTPQQIEARAAARSAKPAASNGRARAARPAKAQDAPAAPQGTPALPAPTTATANVQTVRCMANGCGKPLEEVNIPAKDGRPATKWTVNKLRYQGLRVHGMVLCSDHYKEATLAARAGTG